MTVRRVSVPDFYPEVLEWDFAARGLGNWGAPNVGHARSVVNGAYRAEAWGNDDNHLTSKGGPGRVHLMTFADYHYFTYTAPDGKFVTSDLTWARVSMEIRGIDGFQIQPGERPILWHCSSHPDFPSYPTPGYKIANWGFVAEPRVIAPDWSRVDWIIDPDPNKWVFGAGLGVYDKFLSLPEALQNTYNLHFLVLGPDDAPIPPGAFEMRNPKIVFNRNGPGLVGPTWDASTRAGQVSLSNHGTVAAHGIFGPNGGVRGTTPLAGDVTWTGEHLAGDITKCFSFGIVNESYVPSVNGGTFFADTVNGWGYLTDRGDKRHGLVDANIGPALSTGSTYMVRFVEDYDANGHAVFFGADNVWFNNGAPAYTGLPAGNYYPIESNGTANEGGWMWRADFSGL